MSRFNPQDMPADDVRRLATGRERALEEILRTIDDNVRGSGAIQHRVVTGSRGMGKSFFLRLLQVTLADRADGPPFVLLPEEQPNVHAPADLLREIVRVLQGRAASEAVGRWTDEGEQAWDVARDALRSAVRATCGASRTFVVVAIENFDSLLDRVFRKDVEQSRLRKFLNDERELMVIATTQRPDFEQEYEKRLFLAFSPLQLRAWEVADFVDHLRKREQRDGRALGTSAVATLRGLCPFFAGNPRLGVILVDFLERAGATPSASALDRIIDEMTPYYQELTDRLPDRCRLLFDALLRGGEPCSQTELAERVGTQQSRIAQSFAWLQEGEYVSGETVPGRRSLSYRVRDRIYAHFFRRRFVQVASSAAPLVAMTSLLETFSAGPGPAGCDTIVAAERAQGRAAGFDLGARALSELGGRDPESARGVRALFVGLLRHGVSAGLLEDLLGEAAAEPIALDADTRRALTLVRQSLDGAIADEELRTEDPDVAIVARHMVAELAAGPALTH